MKYILSLLHEKTSPSIYYPFHLMQERCVQVCTRGKFSVAFLLLPLRDTVASYQEAEKEIVQLNSSTQLHKTLFFYAYHIL